MTVRPDEPAEQGAPLHEPEGGDDHPLESGSGVESAFKDPLIGLVVDGRYRIESRLARGGMATVYIAQDQRLERPVALKVMHPHLAESADFVTRFRREARSAARIVHPGVVSVFDQGVVHGQGFLVMELVDGTNLRALLQAQGAFTISQSLRYVQDILEALRAAHRMDVIHRDIKPENVLLPSDGPARVTDFGLARAASEVSMSSTGSMLGTVAYIAPETAASATSDARTDIYAVGIMLYEMLTGAVPWEGETPLQIASHHVRDEIPLPSQSQPWIPREIDDLVGSLAARDAQERPSDAQEALDLVARAAASVPQDIASRRADVLPRNRDSSTTKTTALSVAGLTTALPSVTQSSSQAVVHTSGAAKSPALAEPHRKSRLPRILTVFLVLLIAGGAAGYWWWTEYGPGSYLTMPATNGRDSSAVQSELEAMGLEVLVEQQFSDDIDTGKVISSQPEGGAPVHKDAEVRLFESKGVDMKSVPDLAGLTQEEAKEVLEKAGLALGGVEKEYSEDVAQGLTLSQGQKAGSSIPHDTAIDLVVSAGRKPIEVPDISGLTADAAQAAIEELGLVATPSQAFSDSVAEGTVISQETPSGQVLHLGDSVSYTVSKGPEMVQVPDVTGKQRDEALSILRNAGFEVSIENVLGGLFGTSRYTDPQAGTMAKRGSTITLYVV